MKVPPSRGVRVAALALVVFAGSARFATRAVLADVAVAVDSPAPAPCALVRPDEVAELVGAAVDPPDDVSRAAGICFFATRSVTDEAAASYAIVAPADLAAKRSYFRVQARLCSGVSAAAPRAPACATYAKLAAASDIDAYFSARVGDGPATPLPQLGDAAFATADAVIVRRGARVIEAVVRRGDALDVARSTQLAALVLARL